jgi:acylphosphatase
VSAPVRLSALVHGRVQGVLFRDFTLRHARALGLTGYVRNVPDGTVEVVAEGAQDALETLLRQIKLGPPAALVTNVEFSWGEHSGEFARFEVRY